jgi:PAS domain S-box-containing protein
VTGSKLPELSNRERAEPSADFTSRSEDFQLLVESVLDYAIFMLDGDGIVTTWNLGAERLKGYRAHEIIGRHFSVFYPADDVAAGRPGRELAVAVAESRFEDEGWRVRSDGSRFWANVIVTAMRDERGQLRGFAKVTRDLTEQRRAQEERVRLARVEAALRLRDEFLSIASHELRTPLNALLLHAAGLDFAIRSAVAEGLAVPPGVLGGMESIARQGARLNQLIERLLDVSRLVTGRLAVHPEPMDLVAVASEIVATYRPDAERVGSAIRFAAPQSVRGSWDPLRIGQIVTNLLSNAIKYGGGRPVDVAILADEDHASVVVRDRGIGISRDQQEHIFDRFDRGLAPRATAGLGLGLYIVDRLVRAHGGTIAVESAVAEGSTFTVQLPLRAGPGDPAIESSRKDSE